MCSPHLPAREAWHVQLFRFLANGAAAALLHFAVLWLNLEVFEIQSAGLANLLAAVVGITASFLGSRYYVFRSHAERIITQAARFGALYAAIALLHGAVLYLWSDVARLDYRIGFMIALVFQVALSYLGNKNLVFRARQ
jgi:putative flippase GtrA